MSESDDDMHRLMAVVDHQRRELDRIRAAAAGESVVAMARGALMERLGLSAAEAASQLAELSAATGIPSAEMAAAVLSGALSDSERAGAAGLGSGVGDPAAVVGGTAYPVAAEVRQDGKPGPRTLMVEAAAELAADGAELVAMLAGQVLIPFGAVALALWLLEVDGTLELLGEAGLSIGEANRWRRVPPQLDCPAQRVARGAADLWWPAGQPAGDHAPVIGTPAGARVALALRQRNGELLGVMEASWPGPLTAFSTEIRQQLPSLSAGCARVVAARLAHGDLAAAQPKAAVFALLDDLADSVLVVRAIRDDAGQVTDFSVEHVSPGFCDPAGRAGADLARLTLLAAYPASVTGSGLFARAMRVLADGAPVHVPGPLHESLGSGLPVVEAESGQAPLADLRVARFFDGVIFTWHRDSSAGSWVRLAELLDHAQRLGRLGGWEEDLVTGTVRWTDSAFDLFGLAPRPGAEIPLADLHSYVMAADKPVVKRFRQTLPEQREALTATFRVVHPDEHSIRQIRVFAEPVVDAAGTLVALRGAFQDVSAHYHTQVALAATRDQLADSEQRVAEEHLLALRLQQAIMPPDEHPIEAATGMVAARNSLRGLAITGAGPAELLRMLNGVMCNLTSGVIGTVVCGLYNPETRVLRWARAGHLPPVLVRGETAAELPLPGGVLLGMDPDAEYEEATLSLHPGDTLLLFTDGLIERRGESIGDVLEEFVAAVTPRAPEAPEAPGEPGGTGLSAAAQADRILASAVSDTGDDACLVAVRIR